MNKDAAPPEVRFIAMKIVGNMRDLRAHICAGESCAGWVMELCRCGWFIHIAPVGVGPPWSVLIRNPEGQERGRYIGAKTIEEALGYAALVIWRNGTEVDRHEMAEFGREMDRREAA
ncbi:MAG: hypothetical protein V4537_14170 [Pseudomonadota bacterium]